MGIETYALTVTCLALKRPSLSNKQSLNLPVVKYSLNCLVSVVLHVNPWGFIQFQAMKLNSSWKIWRKLVPDSHHQVFDRTKLIFHKINVNIQVFMVQLFYYAVFNNTAELFNIEHKSCVWISISFQRHMKLKVMPMPIFIGAFTKYVLIFLPAP